MTRIRNVLRQRADRFRRKQQEKINDMPQYASDHDEPKYHSNFIKPQQEPDGVRGSGSVHSLEANGTGATMAETFEDNTDYSGDSGHDRDEGGGGGEFIDLAYAAGGGEFINLQRESAKAERNGINRSSYSSDGAEEDEVVVSDFPQPKTIEFVDSEDGKVFEIPQEETKLPAGLLQNVRSLDESHTESLDGCSKTLNTNDETLRTKHEKIDLIPRENDNGNNHVHDSDRFLSLQVEVEEEEEGEEVRLDVTPGEETKNELVEGGKIDVREDSELYDCDDGQMYIPNKVHEVQNIEGHDEEGTFFEQMRTVQSHHTGIYHDYPGTTKYEDGNNQPHKWQPITENHDYHNAGSLGLQTIPNYHAGSPRLEDPYLSDGNSSWEEGSFATGASRTMSRVDRVYEDEDDDAVTYDGTFDGTEYYSDDDTYVNGDRPFVRILKSLRDLNVNDDCSDRERDDDETQVENVSARRRDNKHRRRRRKSKKTSVLERIGEIGRDYLNETIEYAESQDHQGGTILNTFEALFSCGAPTGY